MAHSAQTDMINKKYFILNYPLANSLIVLAVLFHIWSGGSEFLGIQGYMSDFIAGRFPGNYWAGLASVVIPLLLALTIEFSFVALLRYLLNSLLFKTLSRANIAASVALTHQLAMERYQREKDKYDAAPDEYGLNEPVAPEKPEVEVIRWANLAMYLMAGVAFCAIFAVSMVVSKKSIQYDTMVNGPEAHTHPIDSLDELESRRRAAVYRLIDQELGSVRSAFRRDSQAIVDEYTGLIGAKTEKLNEYAIREQQTDRTFSRSKSIRRQEISDLEARQAQKLGDRSALLATQESGIRDRYAPRLQTIATEFSRRRGDMQLENEQRRQINAERNAWFSGFLRRYAQLATVGQFMCWVYVILAFYVMGIQTKPRVRPESLESGLLADLLLLVYTAPTRFVHNRIRGLLSKVPPLFQMPGVGAVYDIDTLNEIAPLLEQLDKTKSLEERKKLERTISRKIAGYQHLWSESVENGGVAGVEKERSRHGVAGDSATRRNGWPATSPATSARGVDKDADRRRNGVDSTGVDKPVDSVATRSTPQGRGVDGHSGTGVESPLPERRNQGVESAVPARSQGVDNELRQTQPSGVDGGRQRGVDKTGATSIFAVDVREQVVLKAQYEGESQEETVEIRVVIDGIKVKGYYNDDLHPHAFFKKMKQNYEGYFRRKQRNMLTNLLRIELAEKYMDLIERVGDKHNLTVKHNQDEL